MDNKAKLWIALLFLTGCDAEQSDLAPYRFISQPVVELEVAGEQKLEVLRYQEQERRSPFTLPSNVVKPAQPLVPLESEQTSVIELEPSDPLFAQVRLSGVIHGHSGKIALFQLLDEHLVQKQQGQVLELSDSQRSFVVREVGEDFVYLQSTSVEASSSRSLTKLTLAQRSRR
ncbi:hypothetical protein JCM19238_3331 [Vibrio ponticus]|nr:hypothetical protein JCM19238_3331 [Vibrio ponticus]